MSKVVNLTPAILRRIINEEKKKLEKKKAKSTDQSLEKATKETREVGPSEMADTLAKKVEFYKELQAEAAELSKRLSELNETRQSLRKEILKDI